MAAINNLPKIIATNSPEKWERVINLLNLANEIGELYVRTMAYKIEIKRLEVQEKQIIEESKKAHRAIKYTYKLKIQELKQRRNEVSEYYKSLNKELDNLHIERMELIRTVQQLQQSMANMPSIEEKKMVQELALAIIQELSASNNRINYNLQALSHPLPKIDTSIKFLEE